MIRFETAHSTFPILLRVYGDYPIENLDIIPENFRESIYILTTNDYRDLGELTSRFGSRVLNTDFSHEMAVRNSGAFINMGIEHIRGDDHDQVLLMASGYELSIGRIIGLIDKAIKQFEKQDIIYFLLPGIHYDGQLPNRELDIVSDIGLVFPSESLAFLNLNSFKCLDTLLSEKGELGYTENGVPLGGIELMITIIKDFAQSGVSPRMTGINAPHILRGKGSPYLDEFGGIRNDRPVSVEATPNDIKRERRLLTIESACKKLGIELEGLSGLFQNTCIIGEYELSETKLNYQ
jgi:hypothetical protein